MALTTASFSNKVVEEKPNVELRLDAEGKGYLVDLDKEAKKNKPVVEEKPSPIVKKKKTKKKWM